MKQMCGDHVGWANDPVPFSCSPYISPGSFVSQTGWPGVQDPYARGTEGSKREEQGLRSGSEYLGLTSEPLEVWASSGVQPGNLQHPLPKPTPLCSRTECFLCVTQTHMVEPTGAPLPPRESRCQQPLSVPGRRLAERGRAGRDRRGRGQGRRLAFLPGTCYFGPTESLFLLGLRSNESDKTPRSDLFT